MRAGVWIDVWIDVQSSLSVRALYAGTCDSVTDIVVDPLQALIAFVNTPRPFADPLLATTPLKASYRARESRALQNAHRRYRIDSSAYAFVCDQ